MEVYLSAVVCVVGLIMYCVCTEAKLQAIGKDMFWVGLLVFLIRGAGFVIK